jgi:iron complex outermembrane receptor protein
MEVTPLFLFKNIEILRGPSSALYGTNAVQGTVALNSLSASDLPAPAIGLVRIGQQNTQTYDVVAGKETSYASFVVGYNHHRTDGNSYLDYDLSGRADAGGNRQQFLVKDARSSHFGFLKIEGKGALEGLSLQTHLLFFNNQTGHGWLWYISDDDSEYVQEDRQLISLRYTKKVLNGKLTPDVVVRYQRRGLDLHTKLYPNNTVIGSGGAATNFPDGLIENLQTSFHDIFLRAQISWNIRPGMSLTAGAENTIFLYRGDNFHESNVDLSTTFQPWNPPGIRPLGPYLEWLGNNPLNNTGIFLQYFSGRILRNYVSVTAGLRLDAQTFVYNDLTQADRPSVRGTHFAASPRLAILLFPHERLTIKLLGNRAFRAPSPAELFGANTYLLGSNPKVLQPEIVSTGELGIDTTVIPYFTVRANTFYQFVENLIGYAPSTNALLNLYTRGVIGVETEALARGTWGKNNELQGFANYSYAHTVLETVPEDSGLTAHSGRLTWAPAHVVNLGIGYTGHGFGFSMQMHYQGAMQRRDSDMATAANAAMRPASVDGWVSFDARASYSPLPWLQLGVQANNLFNQTGYLIKPNDFPFDYRTDGLRVLGTLQIHAGPFS